jgi:hypothetical protein
MLKNDRIYHFYHKNSTLLLMELREVCVIV